MFDASFPAQRERALALIREAVATGTGVVSYQVVQEFFNVALRRFARPLGSDEAQQYLMTVFRPLVAAVIEARCSVVYTGDLQDGFEIEGLRAILFT